MRDRWALNSRCLLMFVMISLSFSGCSGSEEKEAKKDTIVATVQIVGSNGIFEYGLPTERLQLRAVARNSAWAELSVQVSWTSSDESVALINAAGIVRPLSPGETTITAAVEGISATLDLELRLLEKEQFESEGITAFIHATLLPMTGEMLLEDYTVIVKDGVISQIGPVDEIAVPSGIRVIDLTGKYLMPGMADMHTHLGTNVTESGAGRDTQLWSLTSKGQLLSLAANGVTTVLNNGDFGEPVNAWANDVSQNIYPGPTLYAANWPRGPLDGNGAGRDLSSEQEARDFVRTSQAQGYDFIKLYNQTPEFAIGPLIEESAHQGMGTVGHFPFTATAGSTLQKGMDLVAHTEAYYWNFFRFAINDGQIPMAVNSTRANGTYITTTLGVVKTIAEVWCNNPVGVNKLFSRPSLAYVHKPTSIKIWTNGIEGPRWNPAGCARGNYDPIFEFVKRYTKAFHEAGIPLLIGTDSPTVLGAAGFSMHLEFEILSEMGISNYDILKMTTSNAGEFIKSKLFAPLEFGKIAAGYRADLMVTEANPLDDLEHLKRPLGVMLRGNWYTREFFDAELEALKQAYGN